MIPAQLYSTVYYFIVTILTIGLSLNYANYDNSRLRSDIKRPTVGAFIVMLTFALFIGFRPISGVFIDMMNYHMFYNFRCGQPFVFDSDTDNLLFDNLLSYLAANGYDIRIFFVTIALIYFGGMFIAMRKMFPKDCLYAFVIYLGAFSTFSFGTNGIKAGAAASMFLCTLAYMHNKKYLLLLAAITFGFHHSMVLPLGALAISFFYRNTRVYLYVWLCCILLSALHVTAFQEIFNSMADEQGQNYLSQVDGEASHGFRPDFIFYSSFPILVGYYAMFKHNYRSKTYTTLFNTYLITNSVWMLCMYASFTNRIAYLSWQILPIVMIYPFFDKEFVNMQYRKLNIVAWWHLGFTLAMQVIYYGLIKVR